MGFSLASGLVRATRDLWGALTRPTQHSPVLGMETNTSLWRVLEVVISDHDFG